MVTAQLLMPKNMPQITTKIMITIHLTARTLSHNVLKRVAKATVYRQVELRKRKMETLLLPGPIGITGETLPLMQFPHHG